MAKQIVSGSTTFPSDLKSAPRKFCLAVSLLTFWALADAPALAQPGTGATTAAQATQDVRPLEPGKPIARELAGGQSHTYQIRLTEGQYLNVIVEQRGVDVVVRLLGPDGKQIAEFDSEIRQQGEETVSQVAEVSGSYRLNVQAKQKEAPTGRYEIRVVELRAATEKDRALQEARKLSTEFARLYRVSKFDEARPLVERALEVREKSLGPEHPDVAASLNNLAELYRAKGDYAKAEPLHQRALAIREKALGPDHPDVAGSLNNLAILYRDKGDHVKAEPLYQRALAIGEKALGPDHPFVATSLTSLAILYRAKGDYAKAEPLYQRALAIREKALGPDHPFVAYSLNNLARLYAAKADATQAVAFQLRASAVSERNLALNLATGSERQKLAYLATLSAQADEAISLHVHAAPTNPTARRLATTTILRRKGRVLDAMADSLTALRRRFNAQDQALLDQFKDITSQLARLVLNGPQRMTPAEHQQRIKALEEEKEKLEAVISQRSDEFRAQSQPVTLAAIRAAVPAGVALIEFAVYRPFNPKAAKESEAYDEPRYVAYILRQQGEIQWQELGEAKAIDEAIAALRQALRDPKRKDVRRLARTVDRLVMQPLRAHLGHTRRLLLSPDGALNLLPFAALVDEGARYLVERYTFSYLTSGRDLLRFEVKQPSRQPALIVANPDFGERASERQAATPSLTAKPDAKIPATSLAELYFRSLRATADEARALKRMLPAATVLTAEQATEAAVKQARSPDLLHIATHGFFLPDLTPPPTHTRLRGLDGELAPIHLPIENPLLRSGLALAGANLRRSGHDQEDDGVLTALEATALDLWGTKLVVLSACDTGVGEVKNGEGVQGLRRALVLAGAESQVMSLWPVSDEDTLDLMTAYYRTLQQGQGRSAGLRQVQLRMLKSRDRQHPFYWASFIQSGEWVNLAGKR